VRALFQPKSLENEYFNKRLQTNIATTVQHDSQTWFVEWSKLAADESFWSNLRSKLEINELAHQVEGLQLAAADGIFGEFEENQVIKAAQGCTAKMED
jgi:hypothetical protein